MDIKPDTLCIITKGPMAGISVTAIRPAEPNEVELLLAQRFRMDVTDIVIEEKTVLWHVDKLIPWKQLYTGFETELPFEEAANLLPIPPLADPLEVTQGRELEHS